MIVEIWHPGTPAVPAIPARYVETSGPGWASGAVSIPITTGDGGYKWSIPTSVVGVFIGLASKYPGSGYLGIEHSLMFSRGVVDIYERGQKLGTLGSYVSSDEFTMFRQAGRVWILKNGVKEYDRPSLLTGSFRLAATEFLTGDTVVNADTFGVGVAPTSGDGWVRLAPLHAIGFETTPDCYGVAELEPLISDGREDGHAWGTCVLGGLLTLGSDRPYGAVRGILAPLISYGESGMIAPDFSTGLMTIQSAFAVGRMIPGGVGVGVVTSKLLALGSDRPIAQGFAELPSMFAWGAEAVELRGSVMTTKTRYRVVSSVRESEVNAAQLIGPTLTMAASTGQQARLTGPKLTLAASGTVPALARVSRVLPSLTLTASGTVTEVAGAALSLQDSFTVQASTGGQAHLVGPGGFTTDGEATTVERAEARLQGPGFYTLSAGASLGATARAVLVGPALAAAPSGQAWLVGPTFTLRAEGGEVVSATYESYAINLATGAVSHYTNFPFDNVVRFKGRFFGVKADGIYEIGANTDAGQPIQATLTTFMTNFSESNNKRVLWAYILGRLDDDMDVTVSPDEGLAYTYKTSGAVDGTMRTHRAKVGRGLKGNYFSFTFENVGGADFEIDYVDFLYDVTTRAR